MLSHKLPKTYQAEKIEDKIYQKWEKSGKFNPDNLNLPPQSPNFTMVLPPPNITDKLHMGHASMLAIEDLIIRFHRMRGYRTLWVPGTDHAAIATQNVVEKKLLQEKGLTRHDLGREKFLQEVWSFLNKTQKTILHQTRKMGASLDWSREAFTLDKQRQKAVAQMFVDMYQEGIIYQGERLVNWCPRCHSTLADDEIEYKPQKTFLYTFRYWKNFPIPIATTRPETKLGDIAVAVHPQDKRYKKYIGKIYKGNFCGNFLEIKIIADKKIDKNFGTGAVGVTPAHSTIDWELGEKHKLEIKKVINEKGEIHSFYKKFKHLSSQEARKKIIEELEQKGLLEKKEEIENNLSLCYRCGTSIEPLPSKQWFVSVDKPLKKLGGKSLKEKSIEMVQKNKIQFIPSRFRKRYFYWMENLHDWCISRQIWFGHRIPVWYHRKNKNKIYVNIHPPKDIQNWKQDPDVLDTWFSSGMWTFSTLGWPENFKNGKKLNDLKYFHPTQMLETGYEILTLWVSRMIMMSLFALQEIPFEKVYLHGMILDENGKKMSKSKGNGIDPLDMIKKYNTDAVRLSLLIGNTPGNDIRLSEDKIASFRNFTNKLWNIIKFSLLLINNDTEKIKKIDTTYYQLTLSDQWIIYEFKNLIQEVTKLLKIYNFSLAGEKLYNFTKHSLADWYLEIAKIERNKNVKKIILKNIEEDLLKLWHPFIPFITEYLWEIQKKKKLLMISNWPKNNKYDFLNENNFLYSSLTFNKKNIYSKKEVEKNFNLIKEIIVNIRRIRKENNIPLGKKIDVFIQANIQDKKIISQETKIIKNLFTYVKEIKFIQKQPQNVKTIKQPITGKIILYVAIENALNTKEEIKRIEKELQSLIKFKNILNTKLANKDFIKKAPATIVKKEKEKLQEVTKKIKELKLYQKKLIQ